MCLCHYSDYISTHPALHQRYLWVGSTPPAEYNPDLHEITGYDQNTTRFVVKRKRNSGMSESKEQLPSEEICETKQKWEQVSMLYISTVDMLIIN